MNNLDLDQLDIAAKCLKDFLGNNVPNTVIVLGSGLSEFIHKVKIIKSIHYNQIVGFAQIGELVGHNGRLSLAELGLGKLILIMEGRFHSYEGYTPAQVAFPIAVFGYLGIRNLLVSNAAGGINPDFSVGDLMIISDHINLSGNHPLIGKNNNSLGPRFLDQTQPYSLKLIELAQDIAASKEINLQLGTYLCVSGPTYETRAEIRAFGVLGADAVGMSTVYEVMMANYFKMQVLGISAITNLATGISTTAHDHQSVVNVAKQISQEFSDLMVAVAEQI